MISMNFQFTWTARDKCVVTVCFIAISTAIIHIFLNFLLIHYNQHHLTKTIETCIIRFLEKFVWERSSDKSTTLS